MPPTHAARNSCSSLSVGLDENEDVNVVVPSRRLPVDDLEEGPSFHAISVVPEPMGMLRLSTPLSKVPELNPCADAAALLPIRVIRLLSAASMVASTRDRPPPQTA